MAGSFSLSLEKFAVKTEKQAINSCQKIAMECWKRVIEKSPVGNPKNWSAEFKAVGIKLGWFDKNYKGGRFRANWGVSIGSPYTGTNEDIDPTKTGTRGGKTSAKAVMDTTAWDAKKSIFLCNNLPYSLRLENGYSRTQAPAGMVRISVVEMQNGAAEVAVR